MPSRGVSVCSVCLYGHGDPFGIDSGSRVAIGGGPRPSHVDGRRKIEHHSFLPQSPVGLCVERIFGQFFGAAEAESREVDDRAALSARNGLDSSSEASRRLWIGSSHRDAHVVKSHGGAAVITDPGSAGQGVEDAADGVVVVAEIEKAGGEYELGDNLLRHISGFPT